MDKETFLIVGLGNIGAPYAHTRHNVGFEVTDNLAARYRAALTKSHCRGMLAEVTLTDGRRLVICQPQTLMNLSGECVSPLLQWYKCPLDHLLVICDDIDLPAGRLRLRRGGSPGTHNGLRNITALLPDSAFPRLRVGVGKPPEGGDLVSWVLGRCRTREEQTCMDEAFARAADCAQDWLENGIDHAMTAYNGK